MPTNPVTATVPYSTWGEIVNAAGSTGGYLEQGSTTYATVITTIITRVSRAVDNFTRRRFYTSTGVETRYFDGPMWNPDFGVTYGPYAYATWGWAGRRRSGDLGLDIVSVSTSTGSGLTGLFLANGTNDAANGTYSWIDPADYYLRPVNADNVPVFQWLELSDAPIGTYSTAPFMWFSPGYNTIRIDGKFGWNSTDYTQVPDAVREVVVEETIRWFKSRDASFADMTGVAELTGATPYSKLLSARSRLILQDYVRGPMP